MIVGPTVRGPARVTYRAGDRVALRVAVAGRTGLEGIVVGVDAEGASVVRLDVGDRLGFFAHELRLVRRGPIRVDACRCPEGHPAHGGAA